jgi:hypothetical protein
MWTEAWLVPQLGDRASVRAAGVECGEQPLGGRSAGSGHEPSAFELDAERLVEQSPPCERAVEEDRPRGFSFERCDEGPACREVPLGAAASAERFQRTLGDFKLGAALVEFGPPWTVVAQPSTVVSTGNGESGFGEPKGDSAPPDPLPARP